MQKEPNLPIVDHGNINRYLDNLNWKLTQVLRDMAKEINNLTGSTWDGPHPVLGASHLWIDATGDIRIKSSAPSSDLDGVVVGTQT